MLFITENTLSSDADVPGRLQMYFTLYILSILVYIYGTFRCLSNNRIVMTLWPVCWNGNFKTGFMVILSLYPVKSRIGYNYNFNINKTK